MSDEVGDCGGCFSEMIPLKITATHIGGSTDGPVVGKQCPNCGRTYVEDLIPEVHLRLDRARDNRMDTEGV